MSRYKILIADDDPVGRELLAFALLSNDFEVEAVSDGEQAWHVLQQTTTPILAVLDWHMPILDGLEICRRAHRFPESKLVYLILLTGNTGRDAVVRGLEAGAHDYITKPFDNEEMLARIRVGLRMLTLQQTLADRVRELESAISNVKKLQGLLPICSYCKSIRTDEDYWQQVEHYLSAHTEAEFSHGICPSCYKKVIEPQLRQFQNRLPSRPLDDTKQK